ncbi:hypothetical protein CANINC_003792 [Pichia inconspicua]|uniref:Cation-transporting ATPase n=1 Tax=Pichia inconspicua TaxID=52247 RepID=A0A4T0WXW5_9ASCO|nr:hypothetical protein CANINC_003792 [[Candida] inconspicua]
MGKKCHKKSNSHSENGNSISTIQLSSSVSSSHIGRSSRHRESVSSFRSESLSRRASFMHIDVNDTEMFSGAASHVVPSSISSFHHHNHLKSPSISASILNEPNDINDTLRLESLGADENYYVEDGGYESESHELHERSNFRFFKSEDIESAKGVSSIARINAPDNLHESVIVDYDTNWNSFADDYAFDNLTDEESISPLPQNAKLISETGSNASYGSTENNPYSEFFRGDAERELIADEEQDLHLYGEEGDEDYEVIDDMITKKEWNKTMRERESLKMHDTYFKKFPAYNYSQRFYIAEEDLVVGIAGYQTTRIKLILYNILCILTFGLFALFCRWFPIWRIKLMGKPVPLGKAEWLVVEDEYGFLEIPKVERKWYNKNMSTFLPPKKIEHLHNEDSFLDITDNDTTDIKSGASQAYSYDDIDPMVPVLIFFEYRYMKLFYDPIDDLFKLSNNWIDEKWCHFPDIKDGITENNFRTRRMIFGENAIEIAEKSIAKLLLDEVLHPFYVFQIFSILLWLADDYYYYAFCIFLISIFSIIESLIETKSAYERMRKMSKFQCNVRLWRSGFWKEVSSEELVPGDIYEVSDPSLSIFPCDSILLTGDCIVNEAMLTGESVPVSKNAISPEYVREIENEFNNAKFSNRFAKSFLYNGTKIIRVRYGSFDAFGGNEPATALVVRTGFNTTKGALVRSMLFPKPTGFKFYEDSFKYIGVMATIAGFGFIFSTINFLKLGLGWDIIILRALDLITIVVPPALPATLTIGTNFALTRLRKKNIFCIAPMRVNIGGKLNVICFDKTGTLTEEGLDVMGIHISKPISDRKEHEFTDLKSTIKEVMEDQSENCEKIFTSMLTCHSLKLINEVIVGDPLDENMFAFVGWDMVEDPSESIILAEFVATRKLLISSSPILFKKEGIPSYWIQLKEFEFTSHLRRMSTISLKSSTQLGIIEELEVYVKGAPEVIQNICLPESIPLNYNELLYHYTHNGYRIIACASKRLKSPQKDLSDLSFIGDLKRENVESDLRFIGFIIFENKLKDSTEKTIEQLKDADIRTVMCTGDNILTAISVGRECKMIDSDYKVFIPGFDYDRLTGQGGGSSGSTNYLTPPILWSEVDNPDLTLDSVSLSPIGLDSDNRYCLALTGDVFKYILTELNDFEFYIENILMKTTIFARMSPDEKHELVNQLQKLDYTVGFCGDGANDCGALKAADVGISLSEAEASVAAPFTSRVFEISCVLDVIKEGRASLVTSFSCFQYMSLYSAIQFVTVTLLYKEGTNLGDFQFLYIDLALIIPIAIFMSWSKPYHKLAKKKPSANLISAKIIVPLLGNILLLLVGQLIPFLHLKYARYPWYVPPVPGADDEVKSTDNTFLFLFANFQYIFVACILAAGPPYREPAKKNIPFIVTIFVTSLTSVLLMFIDPESFLGNLMDLTWISFSVKIEILITALINYELLYLAKKYLFGNISKLITRTIKRKGSNKRFKILKREFKTLA